MAILLAPFIACVLDLVARLRRRRVAIAPGLVAFGWRAGAWFVTLGDMWLLAAAPGRLLPGIAVAPLPGRTGVSAAGILIPVCAGLLFWVFVSRPRLVRVERVSGEERIGGLAAGLVGLGLAGLLLTAINPFALVVLLPAAHIWLWLPSAARAGRKTLLAVYIAGMIGPAGLVFELWTAQGLGTSTPRGARGHDVERVPLARRGGVLCPRGGRGGPARSARGGPICPSARPCQRRTARAESYNKGYGHRLQRPRTAASTQARLDSHRSRRARGRLCGSDPLLGRPGHGAVRGLAPAGPLPDLEPRDRGLAPEACHPDREREPAHRRAAHAAAGCGQIHSRRSRAGSRSGA